MHKDERQVGQRASGKRHVTARRAGLGFYAQHDAFVPFARVYLRVDRVARPMDRLYLFVAEAKRK